MFALAITGLLACTEYEFNGGTRIAEPSATDTGGSGSEDAIVDQNGDEPADDTIGDDGGGDSGGDDGGPDDSGIDLDGCEDGYWAEYFNLPAHHPDVEQTITGVITGDTPFAHDWYNPEYLSYRQTDPGLEFGTNWWPVDDGLPGDPYYYAVHWKAVLEVDATGPVSFELGSDDDGWAYLDGVQVADLGGIHAVVATGFTVEMTAGLHTLDLYMAERHTTDGGFWFRWTTPGVRIYACP